MTDSLVRSANAIPPGSPPKTAEPGRVCSSPGCETRLSIYNDTDRCGLHPTGGTLTAGKARSGPAR